jgi:hypothetical protein
MRELYFLQIPHIEQLSAMVLASPEAKFAEHSRLDGFPDTFRCFCTASIPPLGMSLMSTLQRSRTPESTRKKHSAEMLIPRCSKPSPN